MIDFPASRASEPDPQVQEFLQLYESMDIPEFHELSAPEARQLQEELSTQDPGIELRTVEGRTIQTSDGELPIRVYDPRDHGTGERPLILYFHGGGWVVGSLDTHDPACRKLADVTGYPVVSVDYRLAPEHPFPAGLKDCYSALKWAADGAGELGVDTDRIVVAGDSAGGSLAAAVSLLSRDRGGPDIAAQVLVYPATGDATALPSFEENADGYFLTRETMAWFHDQYIAEEIDRGNVYAFPRLAADLSGLPPATVIIAGFDPLRDDGAAYAQRLAEADVPVEVHNFGGMIHGFFNMIAEPVNLEAAHEAYGVIAAELSELDDGVN